MSGVSGLRNRPRARATGAPATDAGPPDATAPELPPAAPAARSQPLVRGIAALAGVTLAPVVLAFLVVGPNVWGLFTSRLLHVPAGWHTPLLVGAVMAMAALFLLDRPHLRVDRRLAILWVAVTLLAYYLTTLAVVGSSTGYGWFKVSAVVALAWLPVSALVLLAGGPRVSAIGERAVLVLGVLGGLVSAWLFYDVDLAVAEATPRAAIGEANPIRIAHAAALGGVVAVHGFLNASSRWWAMAAVAVGALCVAAVVLTGSRGPALGLWVGGSFVVFAWILRRGGSSAGYLAALALAALGAGAILLDPGDFFSRGGELAADRNVQARLHYISVAASMWGDAPLFGNGPGSFPLALLGEDIRMYPHNVWLEMAAEAGTVGLALLVFVVAYAPLGAPFNVYHALLGYYVVYASTTSDLFGVVGIVTVATMAGLYGRGAGER